MSLTPEDIHGKRFHDAFRGYSHEEVDLFLDEVAEAFQALHRELEAGRTRVEEIEAQLSEIKGTETMLKRTLIAAQRAADEAIHEAKDEAARIVSAASDEAETARARAQQQAEDIVADADRRRAEIEELGARLSAIDAAHRTTLRAHLQDQLRALDDLPAPPRPVRGPMTFAPHVEEETAEEAPEPEAEPALEPEAASEPEAEAETESEPQAETESEPQAEREAEVAREVPPPRRVPRERPRSQPPASGAGENQEPSVRELFWGKS
jgi:DivIVA domain-containing protein